jgi:hypothetical protein
VRYGRLRTRVVCRGLIQLQTSLLHPRISVSPYTPANLY